MAKTKAKTKGTGNDQERMFTEAMVEAVGLPEKPEPEEAGPKPHRHSYRKDGTCACGHVRKAR